MENFQVCILTNDNHDHYLTGGHDFLFAVINFNVVFFIQVQRFIAIAQYA